MVHPLRLFAAVLPQPPALPALADLQALLRARHAGDGLRWPDPHWLHMTLRFFGSVPAERLAAVEAAVGAAAADAARAHARLQRIEYWPPRAPRVVVARFDAPPELAALAGDLEVRARALGFAPELRRFRPHITLARAPGRRLHREPLELPAIELDTARLALVSSQTLPEGARYRSLREWRLA